MKKIILFILLWFTFVSVDAKKFDFDKESQRLSTYIASKQYDKAIEVLRYCITLLEENDDEPLRYATFCHGLGSIYYEMGDLNQAGFYFAKGLERLGENHLHDKEYRLLLSDIGQMFSDAKDYNNATQYLNKAKILYEHNLDMDADYARVLNNCALVSLAQGNDFWAKAFIDVTLDITTNSKVYRPEEKAKLYSNTSVIYENMGYYDEALASSQMALDICTSENLGPNVRSQILNNIGILYLNQNRLDNALLSFTEAYDLSDQKSPLRNTIGFNLALVQQMTGNNGLAKTVRKMSDELTQDVMAKFAFLNASQRQNYWASNLSLLLGLNYIVDKELNNELLGVLYNNALFSKGLLLRATNWVDSRLANSDDLVSRQLYNELRGIQERLNANDVPEDSIQALRLKAFSIDKDLMNRNISYADLKKSFVFDWNEIRKNLSQDEIAIEFIQIPEVDNTAFTGNMNYGALVIKRGYKTPHIVRLCNDSILTQVMINPNGYDNEIYREYLYGVGTHKVKKGFRRIDLDCVGDSLYNLIWKPLEKEVEGANRIYYSPIGTLNSIAFGALTKENTPLRDLYNFTLLSSTAEIITLKEGKEERPTNATIYGGIRYDVEPDILVAESRNYPSSGSRGIPVSFPENAERGGWAFLSGTELEAKSVSHLLDSVSVGNQLLMATAANEESFKSMSGNSPSLIHIATHGFYISDPKAIEQNAFLRNTAANTIMNRSGVLFAGANRAWLGQEPIDGIEDGILTAEEISQLDLSNTKIVVLSACETGLGENGMTEGVYGLQRAFKLAGVKTLIMSLWQVPDEATSQLMQLFYDNWLSGMEKHKAFAAAQSKIKEDKPNPYYWAGFVMLD